MLTLRYGQVTKRQSYRLGVVVSRKVSKSAVVRNRIRRRLYERVRILSSIYQPYDLLISVFDAKVAHIPSAELDQELQKLFQKAKLTSARPTTHGTLENKE
jgi:ribonuclease P protein component